MPPRVIPAAESALRSHPCVAISSAQVRSVYRAQSIKYLRRKTKLRYKQCCSESLGWPVLK